MKMAPFKDLTGSCFGKLTVVSRDRSPSKHAAARWECLCDCGKAIIARTDVLKRKGASFCRCIASEAVVLNATKIGHENKTHGHTIDGKYSGAYGSWMSMRNRCNYEKSNRYALYGGRGITVCERWGSFENFLVDMGERPPGMTIDRNDSDGNYEPSNCKWATQKTQQSNRRNNVNITANGSTNTKAEWIRLTGVSDYLITSRIKKGWTTEQALGFHAQPGGVR